MIKDKKVLISLMFVALMVLDLAFFLGFQFSAIKNQDKKIKELRVNLDNFMKEVNNKEKLSDEKIKLEMTLNHLEKKFIFKDDVAFMLSEVSAAAKEVSADIASTSVLPLEKIGTCQISRPKKDAPAGKSSAMEFVDVQFYYLPVMAKIKDNYHDFARFLNILEKKDTVFSIKDFTISGDKPNTLIDVVICGLAKD